MTPISNRKLILITNDDGYKAKGIRALVEAIRPLGDVVVIAPEEGQSAMSHAITIKTPLRVKKIKEEDGLQVFICNGTPVDCVKIGIHQLLDRKPDFVLSGINHGANTSISILYSGTMGAAIEGRLNNIPSIGFSLNDYASDANFEEAKYYASEIFSKFKTEHGNEKICLNVNIPASDKIKGIKVCRQTNGKWHERFDRRTDPGNREYFWLTGSFENLEPEDEDTDEWALSNNFVSVVPVAIDLTDFGSKDQLSRLFNR